MATQSLSSYLNNINKKRKAAFKGFDSSSSNSVSKQNANYKKRLDSIGEDADSRNIIEKALNLPEDQNVLFDVVDILSRPQQAAFGAINNAINGDNVLTGLKEGITGETKTSGGEILRNVGIGNDDNGSAELKDPSTWGIDDILGTAADIVLDPMNLVTAGAAKAVSGAGKLTKGADVISDAGKLIGKLDDAGKVVNTSGKAIGYLDTANDVFKPIGKDLTQRAFEATGKYVVKPLTKLADKGISKVLQGADAINGIKYANSGADLVQDLGKILPDGIKEGTNVKGALELYKEAKTGIKDAFNFSKSLPSNVWNKMKNSEGKGILTQLEATSIGKNIEKTINDYAAVKNIDASVLNRQLALLTEDGLEKTTNVSKIINNFKNGVENGVVRVADADKIALTSSLDQLKSIKGLNYKIIDGGDIKITNVNNNILKSNPDLVKNLDNITFNKRIDLPEEDLKLLNAAKSDPELLKLYKDKIQPSYKQVADVIKKNTGVDFNPVVDREGYLRRTVNDDALQKSEIMKKYGSGKPKMSKEFATRKYENQAATNLTKEDVPRETIKHIENTINKKTSELSSVKLGSLESKKVNLLKSIDDTKTKLTTKLNNLDEKSANVLKNTVTKEQQKISILNELNKKNIKSYSKIADETQMGNLIKYSSQSEKYSEEMSSILKQLDDGTSAGLGNKVDNLGKSLTDKEISKLKTTKTVDKNGNIIRMYHGSENNFKIFDESKIRSNETDAVFNGFWFDSVKDNANPARSKAKYVKEYYLDISNPANKSVYDAAYKESRSLSLEELKKLGAGTDADATRIILKNKGYDGVLYNQPDVIDEKLLKQQGYYEYKTSRGSKIRLDINEDGTINYNYGEGNNETYNSLEDFYKDPIMNHTTAVSFYPNKIFEVDNTLSKKSNNVSSLSNNRMKQLIDKLDSTNVKLVKSENDTYKLMEELENLKTKEGISSVKRTVESFSESNSLTAKITKNNAKLGEIAKAKELTQAAADDMIKIKNQQVNLLNSKINGVDPTKDAVILNQIQRMKKDIEYLSNKDVKELFNINYTESLFDFINTSTKQSNSMMLMNDVLFDTAMNDGTLVRTALAGEKAPLGYVKMSSKAIVDEMEKWGDVFKTDSVKNFIENFKGSDIIIDKKIANMINPIVNPTTSNTLLNVVDKVNNTFKKYKTLSFGFQARNLVGGSTNMMLANIPMSIATPFSKAQTKSLSILKNAQDLIDKSAKGLLKGTEISDYKLLSQFVESGFFNSTSKLYDIEDILSKSSKNIVGKQVDKLAKLNNNLNQYVDGMYKMTLMDYFNKNPEALVKSGYNSSTEAVKGILFSPSATDLSPFERNTMKRIIPFYTFTKQNLMFQLSNSLKNPAKYKQLIKATNKIYDNVFDEGEYAEWEKEGFLLPLPFEDANGNNIVIKLNLPLSDLGEYMSNPLGRIVSATSPMIKAPFELVSGKDMFTGADIKKETATDLVDLFGKYSGLDVFTSQPKKIKNLVSGEQSGMQNMANLFPSLALYNDKEKNVTNNEYNQLEKYQAKVKELKNQGVEVPTVTELNKKNSATTKAKLILKQLEKIRKNT